MTTQEFPPSHDVLTSASAESELAARGGRKALNLHRMGENGFDVPPWAVVGSDAFERFLHETAAAEPLAQALEKVSAATAGDVSRELAVLLDAPMPAALARLVADAYRQVGGGHVAVRSSGDEEDAGHASFAGQFDSYLHVRGVEDVIRHVKRCWASAFNERALRYRLDQSLPLKSASMAVIIQAMVAAETSGVMFTVDPVKGARDEVMISAVYGLGEGLVSGAVDADTIVVDREGAATKSAIVGEKHERVDARPEGSGCVTASVDDAARERLALTDGEIATLTRMGIAVEERFGAPQDIEWAIADGRAWLLQSRPITSLPAPPPADPEGELRLWDNSNIIESYGGITSPLTFTFAQHIYHRVYREFARKLALPSRFVDEMDEWQRSRLGYFHGHVYYNLFNWYRMQPLLPFLGMRRQMLDLSLGVSEGLDRDVLETLRPLEHRPKQVEMLLRGVATGAFSWHFLTSRRQVARFLKHFYETFDRFEAMDIEQLPVDEAYRQLLALERELGPSWGSMVMLESVILVSVGGLIALTKRWLPDAPEGFYLSMVNPANAVESVEPALRMRELAELVLADEALKQRIVETPVEEVYDRLVDDGATGLVAAVDDYVRRFGYRGLNELKLEEPDLHEDASSLFFMLRSAIAEAEAQASAPAAAASAAVDPEHYLGSRLSSRQLVVYGALRGKAQSSLEWREQVRFCRTRVFGLARRLFRRMGHELARAGAIEAERDIFYLRYEEIRGCFEGTISHAEMIPLIAVRKDIEAKQDEDGPPRFTTRGVPYFGGNLDRPPWNELAQAAPVDRTPGRNLSGIPSSPGVVEGVARVIRQPSDVAGGVLVAYRTDPGWAAVLPSASGLLIERGSPLTHVAIVARELRIPTVVQIPNLTHEVESGMNLRVDGATGTVTVL